MAGAGGGTRFMKSLLLLLVCAAARSDVSGGVFLDKIFNVVSYGASPYGKSDSAGAFLRAWQDACAFQGRFFRRSRVVIPAGVFLSGPVSFDGPCKRPMVLQVKGLVQAPTDLRAFPRKEWIAFRHVNGLLVTGSGRFDGRGHAVWPFKHGSSLPPTLKLIFVSQAKIRGISLVNSKFFHIIIGQSLRVWVHNVTISAPGDSPNTDGIHIGDSSAVKITSSTISSGDDCISIGPGSVDVSVFKVACGPGHGISVGSLGKYPTDRNVIDVRVSNCTLTGTANGVRIKTWQDSPAIVAANMNFSNIVMNHVRNPIIIDQEYCPDKDCESRPASRVKISNVRFENIRGTSLSDVAVNLRCSARVPCDNIRLKNVDLRPPPPTPGLMPAVPLTSCLHVVNSRAEGFVFPPFCY